MGKKTTEVLNKLSVQDVFAPAAGTSSFVLTGTKEQFKLVITLASWAQAVAGAALAYGVKLGDFNTGRLTTFRARVDLSHVASGANAITPEIGLGHTLASGANATIGASAATDESIVDGTNGTAFNGTTAAATHFEAVCEVDEKDGTGTAIPLYLNYAGGWNVSVTNTVTGTVTIWGSLT